MGMRKVSLFGDITSNAPAATVEAVTDPQTGWAIDVVSGLPIDPSTGMPTDRSLITASVSTISVPDPTTGAPIAIPVVTTTNTATGTTTTTALVPDASGSLVASPVATTAVATASSLPWKTIGIVGIGALLLWRLLR